MPRLMRAEAGDFNVIAKQVRILGNLVILASEELLLIVEAWAPGQVGADFQVLAENLANHINRMHAFGRVGVMSAAGGVDVMIARPPARLGRIDPALKVDLHRLWALADGDLASCDHIFRPAGHLHVEFTGRQGHLLAVVAIDLRMEKEIGREPLGLRWINPSLLVANGQGGRRGLAILIENVECHRRRWDALEENGNFAAEPDILRPLADVARDRRLTLAGVARIELD